MNNVNYCFLLPLHFYDKQKQLYSSIYWPDLSYQLNKKKRCCLTIRKKIHRYFSSKHYTRSIEVH